MKADFSEAEILAFLDESLDAPRRDALREAIVQDTDLADRVARLSLETPVGDGANASGVSAAASPAESVDGASADSVADPAVDSGAGAVIDPVSDSPADPDPITASADASASVAQEPPNTESTRRFDAAAVIAAAAASASAVTRAEKKAPVWTTPAMPADAKPVVPPPDQPVRKPTWEPVALETPPPDSRSEPDASGSGTPASDTPAFDTAVPDASAPEVPKPSWHVEQAVEPGRFEPSWQQDPVKAGTAARAARPAAIHDTARRVQWRTIAMVSAALALGLMGGWILSFMLAAQSAGSTDWREAVVDHQRLYVPATLPDTAPTEAARISQLALATRSVDRDISASLFDLPALDFRRLQILGLGEKAIVQLLFAAPNGEPVSLAFMRSDASGREPALTVIRDMPAVNWNRDGFEFVLTGRAANDVLQRVAAVVAVRF